MHALVLDLDGIRAPAVGADRTMPTDLTTSNGIELIVGQRDSLGLGKGDELFGRMAILHLFMLLRGQFDSANPSCLSPLRFYGFQSSAS